MTGELATDSTLSGTASATFTAADPGAGVYSATIKVDGTVVETTDLDSNGGRCSNVGGTTDGTLAFLYLRPCLERVEASVELDTTHLANGSHHLEVLVTDAAGNSAPVIDRTITVSNGSDAGETGTTTEEGSKTETAQPLPRPFLTAAWKASGTSRLSIPYGRSASITGRLVDATGTGIAGAQIELRETPKSDGAVRSAISTVRTGANGNFSVAEPAGTSSRSIELVYRDHDGASEVSTSTTLSLTVRAGVTLAIAPRVTSVGHTIRFAGRLLGGMIPTSGKLLVLQARAAGGRWLDFNVIRSTRRGSFRATYRFRFSGPERYQFRVLCEEEADYPFATGSSRVVPIFER